VRRTEVKSSDVLSPVISPCSRNCPDDQPFFSRQLRGATTSPFARLGFSGAHGQKAQADQPHGAPLNPEHWARSPAFAVISGFEIVRIKEIE